MRESMTVCIRLVADTETMMNSVERIFHYSKLETEMPGAGVCLLGVEACMSMCAVCVY